jgi:biotin-dependent carboxylase-like uncharacterized protein
LTAGPALVITRVSGFATIQDLGRPGYMHMGVPPGGPLSPELFARANAAARNTPDLPAIELVGAISFCAQSQIFLGMDNGKRHVLLPGDELSLEAHELPRYIAARGGIDVPLVLGGRGTLLSAGLGGFLGRALTRGDEIEIGPVRTFGYAEGAQGSRDRDSALTNAEQAAARAATAPLRIIAGPDVERFTDDAIRVLLSVTWQLSARRDRVGARLSGGRISRRDDGALESMPMVRGAIQVPPSGEPIVLGPDHPTTGGYPIIAVVVASDLGALYTRPTGAPVRFELLR